MTPSEIEQIRNSRVLSDIARTAGVKLYRIGNSWKGLCPFHKEKTPSFHVSDMRGTFKCFGCGAHGDAIDFVMLTHNVDFRRACEILGHNTLKTTVRSEPARLIDTSVEEDDSRRLKHAHSLWLKREDLGMLAAEYLQTHRKINLELATPYLGYVPQAYCAFTRKPEPALISPIQNSKGHVTAVQLIYLGPEGDSLRDEKGRRLKRTFGLMQDGAVRLSSPSASMGLAGSVEDALSVIQRYSIPTWAVCGEMRLARAWVPDDVETIFIFADADEAGKRFAEEAREAHRRKRHVEVVYPQHGKDFNEEIAKAYS